MISFPVHLVRELEIEKEKEKEKEKKEKIEEGERERDGEEYHHTLSVYLSSSFCFSSL